MKRILFAILIGVVAGIFSTAPGQSPSGRSVDPEKQIAELNLAWAQAINKGDAAALALLFDDDMIVTSGNGSIRNKAGEIKDAAGGTEPGFVWTLPFLTEEVRVRIYKDAAVVTGLAKWGFKSDGQEIVNERRYSHFYVKQKEGWKIVAQQTSANLYKKPRISP